MKTLFPSILLVCVAGLSLALSAGLRAAEGPPAALPAVSVPPPPYEKEGRRPPRTAEVELNLSSPPNSPRKRITATSGGSPKTLVVHSHTPDPKAHEETIEDMTIMARILEKVVHDTGDDGDRHAMGIALVSLSNSRSPRHTRLHGYGALFTFNVDFPLRPGEDIAPEVVQNQTARTDWERARRELYGRGEANNPYNIKFSEPGKPYDAERVKRLQESLVGVLKNASHLRHFGPQEVVTVVVSSAASRRDMFLYQVEEISGPSALPGGFTNEKRDKVTSNAGSDAALTVSARKEDIDRFAEGKMTLDDFRKKVVLLIY